MKIAVTGGAGFIGTVLADLLIAQGHEVILLDIRESAKYPQFSRIANVSDAYGLTQAVKGADAIMHLAAEHRDDVYPVSRYYEVNEEGTDNVISAAEEHRIKTIIFTSTVAVYGLDAGESRENDETHPFNDYGRSKLKAEGHLLHWGRLDPSHRAVIVRPCVVFGPGNRGNVHTLMEQIARASFVMIGSGKNLKSMAYVGNVAAFLAHCLALPAGTHVFNYADKPDMSTRTLVRTIRKAMGLGGTGPAFPYVFGLAGGMVFDLAARLTGRTFPVSLIRVRKFCASTVVNADRAMASGFTPPYTLEQGLQDMISADFIDPGKHAA